MSNQRGITLIVVLVMIVLIGLSAGLAGQSWRALVQREREAELLWRGDQYRKAIASYYGAVGQGGIAGLQTYPNRLEDLLRDPRTPATKRHLRRLYPDPMTGEPFEVLKDPGGRLNGVRSSSLEEPFQKDGFPSDYQDFSDAETYTAWEFRFTPPKAKVGPTTGPTTGPGPSPGPTTKPPAGTGQSLPTVTDPSGNNWPEGWTPWQMPEK